MPVDVDIYGQDTFGQIASTISQLQQLVEKEKVSFIQPAIFYPEQVKVGETVTFRAEGGKSPFTGSKIAKYVWLFPDGSQQEGSEIEWTPQESGEFKFKCRAVDSYGISSDWVEFTVKVTDKSSPVIQKVKKSKKIKALRRVIDLKIEAYDPEGEDLSYSVSCDVEGSIIQQDQNDSSRFSIEFPEDVTSGVAKIHATVSNPDETRKTTIVIPEVVEAVYGKTCWINTDVHPVIVETTEKIVVIAKERISSYRYLAYVFNKALELQFIFSIPSSAGDVLFRIESLFNPQISYETDTEIHLILAGRFKPDTEDYYYPALVKLRLALNATKTHVAQQITDVKSSAPYLFGSLCKMDSAENFYFAGFDEMRDTIVKTDSSLSFVSGLSFAGDNLKIYDLLEYQDNLFAVCRNDDDNPVIVKLDTDLNVLKAVKIPNHSQWLSSTIDNGIIYIFYVVETVDGDVSKIAVFDENLNLTQVKQLIPADYTGHGHLRIVKDYIIAGDFVVRKDFETAFRKSASDIYFSGVSGNGDLILFRASQGDGYSVGFITDKCFEEGLYTAPTPYGMLYIQFDPAMVIDSDLSPEEISLSPSSVSLTTSSIAMDFYTKSTQDLSYVEFKKWI